MTTVTVVTGGPSTGKNMVAEYLAAGIKVNQNKKVFVARDLTQIEECEEMVEDLFLVSSGETLEIWMQSWFEKFGKPLFVIHITRRDPK